jgi:hypothetical protein
MRNAFNNSYDTMQSFLNGNCNAYSKNIKCKASGYLGYNTCYSYGSHYPLIVKLDNGICLLNVAGYSNTTSKHIWQASSLLSKHNKLIIEFMPYRISKEAINRDLLELYGKHKRARKEWSKAYNLNKAVKIYVNFQWYQQAIAGKKNLKIYDSKKVISIIETLYLKEQKRKEKALLQKALEHTKRKVIQKFKLPKDQKIEKFYINIAKNNILTKTEIDGIFLTIENYKFFINIGIDKNSFILSEYYTGLKCYDSFYSNYNKTVEYFTKKIKELTPEYKTIIDNAINDQTKIINGGK